MNRISTEVLACVLQFDSRWSSSYRSMINYCTVCKKWKEAIRFIYINNYKVFKVLYEKINSFQNVPRRLHCKEWFKEFFLKPRRQLYFILKMSSSDDPSRDRVKNIMKQYFSTVRVHEVKCVSTLNYYQIVGWSPKPVGLHFLNR